MCPIPASKMQKLSWSIVCRMQSIMQRQSSFYTRQNLRELNSDEFEQYVNVRTACIHYIRMAHVQFTTRPDTFAAAVNILDVFLWKVKVTERYMSIVAVACYFIAAKMLESDESCPRAKQLSDLHEWTINDLCRMELRILEKLCWSMTCISYLDFLPLFAEVYGVNIDLLYSKSVLALAERCLSKKSSVLMQPGVLALALLHHVTDDQLHVLAESQVLVYCNISESDLNQCKKNMSFLSSSTFTSPPTSPTHLTFPKKIFDKPSEMGITCLPTIVEEPSA